MISCVIPLYHKADLFAHFAPMNRFLWHHDFEVVLVADHPGDGKVIAFARDHPSIRCKVILNTSEHPWQAPSVPINVGIRESRGEHVAIFSPETVLRFTHDALLADLAREDDRSAHVGFGWNVQRHEGKLSDPVWLEESRLRMSRASTFPTLFGLGFILVQKFHVERLGGFDERSGIGCGEDVDFRSRLVRFGVPVKVNPGIEVFHFWHDRPDDRKTPSNPGTHIVLDNPGWGKSPLYQKVWDWQ